MMLYGDKKVVGEKEVVIKIEWAGGSTKGNGSWRNIAGGSATVVCVVHEQGTNSTLYVLYPSRSGGHVREPKRGVVAVSGGVQDGMDLRIPIRG